MNRRGERNLRVRDHHIRSIDSKIGDYINDLKVKLDAHFRTQNQTCSQLLRMNFGLTILSAGLTHIHANTIMLNVLSF